MKFFQTISVAFTLFAFAGLIVVQPTDAQAGIFKCKMPNGSSIFQDQPCPIDKPVGSQKVKSRAFPLGIHESWFEIPTQNIGRPFCDKRGCICGAMKLHHDGALEQAVADALYIDANWYHYGISYQAWLNTPTDAPELQTRHEEMINASCTVMMSQQVLRRFAPGTTQLLKKKSAQAKSRGFDTPTACDNGSAKACEGYDAISLYQRIQTDSKALQVPRTVVATSIATDSEDELKSATIE